VSFKYLNNNIRIHKQSYILIYPFLWLLVDSFDKPYQATLWLLLLLTSAALALLIDYFFEMIPILQALFLMMLVVFVLISWYYRCQIIPYIKLLLDILIDKQENVLVQSWTHLIID
jgi:hypothetical protein